jgi:hypothetical protein
MDALPSYSCGRERGHTAVDRINGTISMSRKAPRLSTGANAFEHLFGMRSFEHASLHPDRAAIFDAYMADLTRVSTVAILASHDFSG